MHRSHGVPSYLHCHTTCLDAAARARRCAILTHAAILVVWLLWADRVWDFEISNNLLCETEKKQWQYGGLSRVAGCDVRRFGCVRRTLQRQSHDLYLLWRARCNCTLSGRGLLSNAHSCGSSFHGKQDLSIAFHTLRFARPSGVCAPPFAHVMSVPSSILQWWP
jgi:hypothetical protein